MFEISKLSALVAYELMLALTVALAGLIVFIVLKRNDRKTATTHLSHIIEEKSQFREAQVFNALKDNFNFEDAKLKETADKIAKKEVDFFRNMITRLKHGNQQHLIMGIHNDFYKVIDGYQTLKLSDTADVVEPDQDNWAPREKLSALESEIDQLNDQIEELKTVNIDLTNQVKSSANDMGKMLSEYTNMFGNKDDQAEMMASKERMLKLIGQAVEQLSLSEEAESNDSAAALDEDKTLRIEDKTVVDIDQAV